MDPPTFSFWISALKPREKADGPDQETLVPLGPTVPLEV